MTTAIPRTTMQPSNSEQTTRSSNEIPASRFLTDADCSAVATRIAGFRTGGGESRTQITSSWRGAMQFARNQIRSSGDRREDDIIITRNIEGAERSSTGNQIDDDSLHAMVMRAERLIPYEYETGDVRFQGHIVNTDSADSTDSIRSPADSVRQRFGDKFARVMAATGLSPEPIEHPKLLFESTLAMESPQRAAAVVPLVDGAVKAGMLASGYIEVSATGTALIDTYGNHMYYPMSEAQYTVTVRTPDGTGSGWAGIDWNDWNRIDGVKLSAIALDKCLRSRNPVRVEPGRYTAILEPQAVHDLFWPVIYWLELLKFKSGSKVFDERITVTADPMDPDCAFLPIDLHGNAYHAATWFERGLAKDVPHNRLHALRVLHKNTGLPNSNAYRMQPASGVTPATVDEMVTNTERGIVVTRFWYPERIAPSNLILTGYTRDGTWLVEKGKITQPIKNLKFTIDIPAVFNNVLQIGTPQRVFSRAWAECPAAVVPPMKVRDFNFTALTDAI